MFIELRDRKRFERLCELFERSFTAPLNQEEFIEFDMLFKILRASNIEASTKALG